MPSPAKNLGDWARISEFWPVLAQVEEQVLLPAAASCSSVCSACVRRRWMKSHPRSGLAGPAANRVRNASHWNVRTGLKYEWQPSRKCGHWQRFDPDFFCAAMRRLGGPLLIVGDSLSKSMLESLVNLFQMKEHRPRDTQFTPTICRHWERTRRVEQQRGVCRGIGACKIPIVRVRNDRLTLVEGLPHATRFHGQHTSAFGEVRICCSYTAWIARSRPCHSSCNGQLLPGPAVC